MKYIKRFNEDTSSPGGLSYGGESGNVYSMPTTGGSSSGSTVGPNAIGNNVGSINMNNTDIKEPTSKPEKKQRKKRHKRKKIDNAQESTDEKPVMNWDEYTKKNINKINI